MIYRVVRAKGPKAGPIEVGPAITSRPPGNVPYFVDNIWEWLRPHHMPSRRQAAFASPTPELAAMAAGGSVDDAWKVELCEQQAAVQLTRDPRPQDARYHADISRLKTTVLRELLAKSWYDLPVSERKWEAILFTPCASAQEVSDGIRNSSFLDEAAIRSVSTFWLDVDLFGSDEEPPHNEGEIFFAGSYKLIPLLQ